MIERFKKAFSLAELLITLIIVSCILAAFAPVITKKMVNVGAGGNFSENCAEDCNLCFGSYCLSCSKICGEQETKSSLSCTCINCRQFDENCLECDSNKCKKCLDGYILDNQNKCVSCKSDEFVNNSNNCESCKTLDKNCLTCNSKQCLTCKDGYTPSGKRCISNKGSFVYFDGLKIHRFNAGDEGGPAIPNDVSVVDLDDSKHYNCNSSESTPCCWGGRTSSSCNSNNSDYSGCERTVCDYWAASKICSNLGPGWRLPTNDEIKKWRYYPQSNSSLIKELTGKSSTSLQLCDNSSSLSGISMCNEGNACVGTDKEECYPASLWSSTNYSDYSSYNFKLDDSEFISNYFGKANALSVRCVKSVEDFPKGCLIADDTLKCKVCKKSYKLIGGRCLLNLDTTIYNGLEITRFNAGDVGGAPLPDEINLVEADSQACSSSENHPCCWGGKTAGDEDDDCNSNNSNYSGCDRTVCDWWAADKICSSLGDGWRLPTSDEIKRWREYPDSDSYLADDLVGKKTTSLQLCSTDSGSSVNPYCDGVKLCNGAGYNFCYPYYIWSSTRTTNANYYYLDEDILKGADSDLANNFTSSVRCVRPISNWPKNCLIASLDDDGAASSCTKCKKGYKVQGGACVLDLNTVNINGLKVTRVNAGDIGGAPIPDDVYLLEAGNNYCNSTSNHPCCYSGATSKTDCDSTNSDYSGCNRTVCDWWAGNKICKSFGWSLPTNAQMQGWREQSEANSKIVDFLKGNKATSLQLCGAWAGNEEPWCAETGSCPGPTSSAYCWQDYLFSQTHCFGLYGGVFHGPYSKSFSAAYSVRCVK